MSGPTTKTASMIARPRRPSCTIRSGVTQELVLVTGGVLGLLLVPTRGGERAERQEVTRTQLNRPPLAKSEDGPGAGYFRTRRNERTPAPPKHLLASFLKTTISPAMERLLPAPPELSRKSKTISRRSAFDDIPVENKTTVFLFRAGSFPRVFRVASFPRRVVDSAGVVRTVSLADICSCGEAETAIFL